MIFGIVAAVVAALAYGTASVLQARGARTAERAEDVGRSPSLRSTVAAVLTGWFLAGLCLDALGFLSALVSARLTPLFLSQTVISANLVVTAILATLVLGTRLSIRDRVAIGVVVVALVALAFAAGGEGHQGKHETLRWTILLVAIGVFLLAVALIQVLGNRIAVGAGLAAGALFGMLAIGVRIADGLSPFDLGALLTDPAAYAVVVGGVGGFYLFTVALQTGSAPAASAAIVVGETVIPGAVGIAVLGDTTREGWGPVAVVAFAAAVIGAIVIASSPTVIGIESAD